MGNRDVSKPNNDGEPCGGCISRRAVLALPRNKVRDIKTMEVVCETINVTDIETLPPAQPEIVRCKYCKHREAKNGFCEGRGWPMQLVPDDGFCEKGERSDKA